MVLSPDRESSIFELPRPPRKYSWLIPLALMVDQPSYLAVVDAGSLSSFLLGDWRDGGGTKVRETSAEHTLLSMAVDRMVHLHDLSMMGGGG